ncbi:MAG: sigma-70 family RNA polymerase sigma factor [Verrucomicrobiales bacterium]|nr:sigma-70 family RNA polymerase sigma factor [Verrucomicrobiales bacterium]
MSEATQLLEAVERGEPHAAEELLPLVYDELRRLANSRMASEKPGQTLQPTALVHEAWLKLMGSGRERWQDSRHFIAAAAEAMRRIMVDRARRKATGKHGGQHQRVELEAVDLAPPTTDENLLLLDEALKRLTEHDAQTAEIVKLRYFVGLTTSESADALGISVASVKRQWAYARAWLFRQLRSGSDR